jgi:LSD1 subclass zinc finger protein
MMKKCIPSCCKKSTNNTQAVSAGAVVLPSEQQVICGTCKTLQSVSKDATVFVCLSCHTVNRVNPITAEVITNSPEANQLPEITLKRVNSSTYLPVDQEIQTSAHIASDLTTIGHCSVCMDGAGDMIFLNCHHGGFC